MLYVVTALKSEAQAFVDRYKLKKEKLEDFTLFRGADITLVISGIGTANASRATSAIIEEFDIGSNDTFLNVGICGASKEHELGELLEIGLINYNGGQYIINEHIKKSISCLNEEISDERYEVVDMESFGFYEALKKSKNRNFHIFKVVSDHFEPHTVTKEGTKKLISNVTQDILKRFQA